MGAGTALATVEFAAWKAGRVSGSQHEIAISAPRQRDIKLEPVSTRLKQRLRHPNSGSGLTCLEYSPDGRRIIAADYPGGVVQVWEAETGKQLTTIETGAGYRSSSEYIWLSPDWKTMYATLSERGRRSFERIEKDGKQRYRWKVQGEARAWDLASGEVRTVFKHTPDRGMENLTLSPDATTFLTSGELSGEFEHGPTDAASIWDVKTGRVRPLPADFGFFFRFAPDGRSFSTTIGGLDGHSAGIKLVDVATLGTKLTIPVTEKNARVLVECFAPDGKVMIGTVLRHTSPREWQSALKFWDVAAGRELAVFRTDEKNGHFMAYVAAFSPNGQTVAVPYSARPGGRDGRLDAKLYVFQCATGKLLAEVDFGRHQFAGAPAFSPDGRWIAVVCRPMPAGPRLENATALDYPQPRVHLIDAATGQIRETLVPPQAIAGWARFSPDGKTLATTGNGEVLLWDLARTPGTAEE